MIEIECADAFKWLPEHKDLNAALITSLPDADELAIEPEEWENWFVGAIVACLDAAGAPVVFYQTDRKANRRLYSKANMIFSAAEVHGWHPLWHKIAYRVEPMKVSLYRPAYSHMIALSPSNKFGPGKGTPDIFDRGPVYHTNGAGAYAATLAAQFLATFDVPVLNPFCGYGTFLRALDYAGVDGYGCDLAEHVVEGAKNMIAEVA